MIKMFTPVIIAIQILIALPGSTQKVTSTENISIQPLWGPVGYKFVEYYYLPSCEIYYHVPTSQFIYQSGSDWLYSQTVPFSTCDLFDSYKVVLNEARPYFRHKSIVLKSKSFSSNGEEQVTINESTDRKYFIVEGHPQQKEEEVYVKDDKANKVPAKVKSER